MSTETPSAPSSYLRYLPAVYGGPGAAFVGDYLKIFEKILTGIDDDALNRRRGIHELLATGVIGNLFYPRLSFLFEPDDTTFIPPISGPPADPAREAAILGDLDRYIGVPVPQNPTASFEGSPQSAATPQSATQAWLDGLLNWLGGWVDLIPDDAWSIDKKRNVIAQILALYRLRGTPQGLGFLIDLLFDLPVTITGLAYQPAVGDEPARTVPLTGVVTVSVGNPAPPCIGVSDQVATAFRLREQYERGAPVVAGYFPWRFDVLITLPNAKNPDFIVTQDNVRQVLALQQQLEQLLAKVKPAATRYTIGIVPTLQLQIPQGTPPLCSPATLGRNTLLGSGSGNP
ncbi:hypothetical protein WL05_29000 [Burkholderia ubonensis]|uniref:phage tail protein n=1 Tax=Burkholderia ubonensis TaxID=101571 RepID=UPI00075BFCBF|nr:phage tail protein [Burkholderia ubonensis]KVO16999.1 hypothetical protein WJ74_09520 [Burkholderia ubonensis]KVU00504.1 hypothetical protein WK60_35225 [Burkholderia ubonensis]KVX62328.1 hypothetical protein WL05_29000 [Burkholderia ubonensis]KVZ00183.1 hypothetical protein WL10_27115 [Burkholderia ubonensis]